MILPKMYGPRKEEIEVDGYYTDDVADELLRFLLESSCDSKDQFLICKSQKNLKRRSKSKNFRVEKTIFINFRQILRNTFHVSSFLDTINV